MATAVFCQSRPGLAIELHLDLPRAAESGSLCAVPERVRSFLKYWLAVLIWMGIIFSASSDTGSLRHSSRIIEPVLRWLFPHISDNTVGWVVFIARKCAHMTEFGVLGLLLWRAVRKPLRTNPRPWSWKLAGGTILLVALYASSDEFHQSFVPGRDASVHDVMIDTLGGAGGMLLLWALGSWRGWWRKPGPAETKQH
jgi:VanZ family protein